MGTEYLHAGRGAIRSIAVHGWTIVVAAALLAASACATGDAPADEPAPASNGLDPSGSGDAALPGVTPGSDASTSNPGAGDASADTARPRDGATQDAVVIDTGSDATPTCQFTSQRYCSGRCIDVQLDPVNCGACGHSCMGQPCVNGSCTPVTLSSQFTPQGAIAQDATTIYFVGGDGALRSVPKAGGTTTTIATGLSTPVALAVDATSAYVAAQNAHAIVKVALAGGAQTTLASGQTMPQSVAVDASYVYWTTYGSGAGNGTLMKCAVGGCNNAPTILVGNMQIAQAAQSGFGPSTWLAIDPTAIFFTTFQGGGEVRRMAINGGFGTSVGLYSGLGFPTSIATSGGNTVFVQGGQGGAITKDTPSGMVTLAYNQPFPIGVAVTSTDVYWTYWNPGWASGAQVAKCPLAGCPNGPQALAQGIQPAEGIIVDGTSVYWLSNDGTVLKTPR
jgi:hypothetical protein